MGNQAIEGRRVEDFARSPESVTIIGIDTKHKNKLEHPLYDSRINLPLDEGLKETIKLWGVLDEIQVKKDGDDVIVVDGIQRVRAARKANAELKKEGLPPVEIRCHVRSKELDEQTAGIKLVLNEFRHDDPIVVKAQNAHHLLENCGWDKKKVAILFGLKSTVALDNWLALLDLDPVVRKGIDQGKISPSAAAKLAPLKKEEQRGEYKEMIAEGNTSAAQAAVRTRTVKATKNGASGTKRSANGQSVLQPALSKRKARSAIEANNELPVKERPLSEDFIRGMRVQMGDLAIGSVKGLSALLKDA